MIPLLISLDFWRERHLCGPRFLSAHPGSLLLIYLSKSLIFCISKEDVNGKEFPPLAEGSERGRRAGSSPRGAEAKVIKRRGVTGPRGVRGARSPLPRRARRNRDPGAAAAAAGPHPAPPAAPELPGRLGGSRHRPPSATRGLYRRGRRPRCTRLGRAAARCRRLGSRGLQGQRATR